MRPSDGLSLLEQMAIGHTGRTHRLARTTTEAAVDVGLEGRPGGLEPALGDRPHEMESSAGRVGFVTQAPICRTGGQAEAAMHARQQSLVLGLER